MDNVNFLRVADIFREVVTPFFRQNHDSVGDGKGLPNVTTVGVPTLLEGFLELPVVVMKDHTLAGLVGHAGHD